MKKLSVLIAFLFCFQLVHSQTEPSLKIAQHVAGKMADSLGLTPLQRENLLMINLDLAREKRGLFDKTKAKSDVEKALQKIEGNRDSRYAKILTKEQYALYLIKKPDLISSK